MLPSSYVCIDVETTGLSVTRDRIIEIGMLRVENNTVVKTYESLVNPQMYVSPLIEDITGISKEALEAAPTFEEILDEVQEFCEGAVFVAHNARFDYGFIKNEFGRFGHSFSAKCLCTAKLSRALFPEQPHHNLDSIIAKFGFSCERRHRAFDDAKVLVDFLASIQHTISEDILTQSTAQVMKRPSLPTHIDAEQVYNLPQTPGVYLFYGENNLPLYVGKSTNIRTRVLSHFTNDHSSSKEMTMCQQIKRIESISTAGELGALLKESELIKTLLPLYNRKSRLARKLIAIKKLEEPQAYTRILFEEIPGSIQADQLDTVITICSSKQRAKEYLLMLCKEYQLCEKLVGLEKTKGACFQYRLGQCKGACVGEETVLAYNMRLIMAISKKKITPWPFPGPIAVKEISENEELSQITHIDKWCLLTEEEHEKRFDMDTYTIIKSYIKNTANHKYISLVRNSSY